MGVGLRAFLARHVTERVRGWAHWAAPYRGLWLREKADHDRTRAALAVSEADLAASDGERTALHDHLALAVEQRDRARALAAELGGRPRWNEADDVWLADNGVGPA